MTIILDADELEKVTGYKTPKRQVKELPKQQCSLLKSTA